MQNGYSDNVKFTVDLCFFLFAVMLITVTLVTAEAHLTSGNMIASAEIENGCSPCGASMALVSTR